MLDQFTNDGRLDRIYPFIPWALGQLQSEVKPVTFGSLSSRSKASMVHDLVMDAGGRSLTDEDGVVVANSNQLLHFVYPDVKVRVKHARPDNFEITVNRTEQTKLWTFASPLPGIADPYLYLHLVYCPDEGWAVVERAAIALYWGNTPRLWREIDLDGWDASGGASIDPITPQGPSPRLTLKPGYEAVPLDGGHGSD